MLVVLLGAGAVSGFVIDYQWWREIGQLDTWIEMLAYGFAPRAAAAVVMFVLLWVAHARALKRAGTGLGQQPLYARASTLVIALVALSLGSGSIDAWTLVRYFGGHAAAADAWRDPVFQQPLEFYFFQLPFYRSLLRFVLIATILTSVLYLVAWRLWQLRLTVPHWQEEGFALDLSDINWRSLMESRMVRGLLALALCALALEYFLQRYDQLFVDHGSLVGVDWVAEHIKFPLLWLMVAASLVSAAGVLAHRPVVLLTLPLAMLLNGIVPAVVHSLYVRPSEITIQKPYIARHIEATREAWGLGKHVKEIEFAADKNATFSRDRHKLLLDNVRLWDWRAFHDTVTQIQALRPYYVFADSDVDRYRLNGQLRQVLLTPRELDVRQLPADARSRWINPHFIYTHGYGMVVAEASRITPDGLPVLLMQDAPTQSKSPDLKLTRPELYYGEVTHEPVYVRTAQPEFNYPQGSSNVENHYDGQGGFPITSMLLRLAVAVREGDYNVLLTSYLTGESRMMIRRNVRDRLEEAAGFLVWDADPYLVITPEGRQVWMVDGYTTSDRHPYSKLLSVRGEGSINYIRNSVKATVDAYDGTVKLYAFDEADPVLRAYRRLFPKLIQSASEMPAALREHARYPEMIFRMQAEIYRTFHMRDAEAFFNKEDMWDLARKSGTQGEGTEAVSPTYIVGTMPDSDEPEFLLLTTFTPRNKDNLIGLMVARCDGTNLGEIVFLQLSKQELVYGPMQIEARIRQDQNISKDLTLWNQQGSQVLRGQILVLPVEKSFLYIAPIYIQSSQARMPQLKKIAMALGDRLAYADTYDQALAELLGAAAPSTEKKAEAVTAAPAAAPQPGDALREKVRAALQRYRTFMSQGRYAEAGRELEGLEKLLEQR